LANCKTTGVFQPSHCRGLLYDAIHGWMTGRMDGWKASFRPRPPLLYVIKLFSMFNGICYNITVEIISHCALNGLHVSQIEFITKQQYQNCQPF
jgi:hypothetical protein